MSATEERNRRLTELLPAIQGQSKHWTCRYPQADIDPADVVQEAILFYLQSESELTCLDDAALINRVVKSGWNAARRQHYQERHQIPLTLERDDGEEFDGEEFEFASDESIRPVEDAVCANELAKEIGETVARLKPNYQTVCRALASGSTKTAAMQAVGSPKQSFQWYCRKLRHSFAAIALL